jgi:hypothetical protein
MKATYLWSITFLLILYGCSATVDSQIELDQLQGTWSVLGVETFGERAPEEWFIKTNHNHIMLQHYLLLQRIQNHVDSNAGGVFAGVPAAFE